MSVYCDTSVIVAALTPETWHDEVAAWLSAQAIGGLISSGWVDTEVASALSLKVRSGALRNGDQRAALALWARIRADVFDAVPIHDADFVMAADLLRFPERGLRAGDALHIAIASNRDLTFATLDRRAGEIAREVGVRTATVLVAN